MFPLGQNEGFYIKKGQNQPILIKCHADENTPSGLYKGYITIDADGCDSQQLPVKIIVWDFSISKEQHITISIPIWGGQMEKMYGKSPERKKRYISSLLDYRISPFPLTLEETVYARSRGMKQFCVLTLPKDHVPQNLKEKIIKIVKKWEQAGLFEKGAVPYVLLGDEPCSKEWKNILAQGKIVHEADPRILRMNTIAIERLWDDFKGTGKDGYIESYKALGDVVDYFIPAVGCYHVDSATKNAYKLGQKVWWYSVADNTYIPSKGGYDRVHLWKMWKYGIPGWLHWGMTYWGGANIAGKGGKKWPDVPWDTRCSRSGDGYLVYPACGGKGYWPSFRLEIIRDGVEDYEYFWMLKHLTEQLKTVDSKKYAKQISENQNLLTIDADVVSSYREATKDGEVLLESRKRLASAICTTQEILKTFRKGENE